jgi:hypothetical protein
VAVALFFFSCEDESGLLGFKNPNKKFHVRYVDIPLNASSVLLADSLITDLRPLVESGQVRSVDGLLVGEYLDNELGKITASSYLTIYPLPPAAALPATAVFDSVTVQFRLNFEAYGFSGNRNQQIAVHEITGDTLTIFNGNRYYYNSPAPVYSPEPLGYASVTVNYDTLRKQGTAAPTQQDTVLATGRLTDEYGARIFEAIRAGASTSAQRKLFKYQIKGLALRPGPEPGILGLNVVNNQGQLSGLTLHYHTLTDAGAVADTLIRLFGVEYESFAKIEADRSTTELSSMQPYQSVELARGLRYIQSGSPVVTKLDLTPFYNFADTVDNILINSAELVIDNVSAPPGQDPHNTLVLRLMNNNSDQFLNNRITADRQAASEYYVLTSASDHYYFATTDGSVPATVSYDKSKSQFSGFMTLFAQSLFAKKNDTDGINENRLKYVALYPVSPPAARSVTRTVFHKDNVKLRIFYTRANTVTP